MHATMRHICQMGSLQLICKGHSLAEGYYHRYDDIQDPFVTLLFGCSGMAIWKQWRTSLR